MCVIFFKPAGVALPKVLDMKKMYWDNDDGLGFMYVQDGKVVGKKFQTLDYFLDEIQKVPRTRAIVGHFRIATHGGKSIEFSQPFPFPIQTKVELHAVKWSAEMGVAHNGVVTGYGDSLYPSVDHTHYTSYDGKQRTWLDGKWVEVEDTAKEKKPTLRLSDTQDFLWSLSQNKALRRAIAQNDAAVFALLKKLLSSKWAFMNKSGKVRILGQWSLEKGIWYSNLWWQAKQDPTTPIVATNISRNTVVGRGHYPDTPLMLPEVTKETASTKEVDSRYWKSIVAEKECANWNYCTHYGKKLHKCLERPEDTCSTFEETIMPINLRKIYLGGG